MATITIDSATSARFGTLTDPVIVLDPSGRKLGRFLPEPMSWEQARITDGCPHSVEELQSMRAATEGESLADFWKRMGRA
jgi:hypothetical protein